MSKTGLTGWQTLLLLEDKGFLSFKLLVKNVPAMQGTPVQFPVGWKYPLEKG